MSIMDEYRKRRTVTESKFKIIQEGASRIFTREESSGFVRRLHVWSFESCQAKVREKLKLGGKPAVDAMIKDFAQSLGKFEGNNFYHSWWLECWEQMTKAYDEEFAPVVAPDDTIEVFGEDLEEFGA